MSMNATDEVVNRSATLRATVDFPEPDPPAIPMMRGFNIRSKAMMAPLGTHYAFFPGDANTAKQADLNENPIGRICPFSRWNPWLQCPQASHRRQRCQPADGRGGRQSGLP